MYHLDNLTKKAKRPRLPVKPCLRSLFWMFLTGWRVWDCKKISKVFIKNYCHAILNGPDGWAKVRGLNCNKRQEGGRGVHYLGGIIREEIIGPIKVEDGVKFQSKGYCEFLEDHFMIWYRNLNSEVQKKLVFQHDNAPWKLFCPFFWLKYNLHN